MKRYSKSEAVRAIKRLFKTGELEPRKKISPLVQLTDAQLLEKLSKTKDNRKAQRISREIARRLELARYHQQETPHTPDSQNFS